MNPVFVDTSAFIALGNRRDAFYRQAQEIRRRLVESQRTFVTTHLIIVELCSAFSPVKFRSTAVVMVDSIMQSDKWESIEVNRKLMERGFERFKQMTDKEWSLVDCISMIVAEDYGVLDVFTNDHHFEQAGFQILLKT
jgi:predicted nucleic acid-binding protein